VVCSVGCIVGKRKEFFLLGLERVIVKGIVDETANGKNERESEGFFEEILDRFTKR